MIRSADIRQIGTMIATNTMLFSALDLGQWIADKFALWSLPAGRLVPARSLVGYITSMLGSDFLYRHPGHDRVPVVERLHRQ